MPTDYLSDDYQKLMRRAVRALRGAYGWDERTAASCLMTITSVVDLAEKPQK